MTGKSKKEKSPPVSSDQEESIKARILLSYFRQLSDDEKDSVLDYCKQIYFQQEDSKRLS